MQNLLRMWWIEGVQGRFSASNISYKWKTSSEMSLANRGIDDNGGFNDMYVSTLLEHTRSKIRQCGRKPMLCP
jgi:hypothetical protein